MSKFLSLTYHGTDKPCIVDVNDIATVVPDRDRTGSWINRKSQGHFYGLHVHENTNTIRDRLAVMAFMDHL